MAKNIAQLASDNIRILSASMVEKAKSGHPGGAMGGADFVQVLYSEFLNFDPQNPTWFNRDRFFLDPGHMSPMLYSILALNGLMKLEDLKQFRQWDSAAPGHPEIDHLRGIENTSGPLGAGHTFAVGAAIAEQFLVARFGSWMSHYTYAYISDGGIQEEISQGAGRIAGFLGLEKLIMFYDSNDIQLSSTTAEVSTEDTEAKYKAWGWRVICINGNDADEIRQALRQAQQANGQPTLIIGKTIMGKGAVGKAGESFESKCATHGMPLGECGASYEKSIANLGGDPENPFVIFPEVEAYYQTVRANKIAQAAAKKAEQAKWEKENPALADKLALFISGKLPEIDFASIVQKANIPTRNASGSVLEQLAGKIENLIVASADLSNSDKTDAFLKKTHAFTKGDFTGSFFQAGVAELSMAAICTGMAIHGGVIPTCATFFVFSDYMKPIVRISALMQLPVKYIWTHDSFRVGEDGPTHQPIEHEAQIRLLEQLENHSHKASLLVLRPADAAETTVAWKMALENNETPTALIFSRQNVKDLPCASGSAYEQALQASKGGYAVKSVAGTPDVVLVANGSEVSTLVGAAEILETEGIKANIVSVISEGLLNAQPAAYRKALLPAGIPTYGLTAGLPSTLGRLVGPHGMVHGLKHFGFSAPATVLDEKFGFTPKQVAEQIKAFLKEN